MLLYDWKKIFRYSKGTPSEAFLIFKTHAEKPLPKNKFDPAYKYCGINFSGESFLVHPDVLLANAHKYTHRELCVYLSLASIRSLSDFAIGRETWLDMIYVDSESELIAEEIKNSSLLYVENNRLYFLYEEVPKEKLQWH